VVKITRFEDLTIWKLSLKVTRLIYDLTSQNKFVKDFGLKNQMQRAIVSVSSNIVEGFEKNNNNEFIRYLKIAKGSIGEVRNQLYISRDINYINDKEFNYLNDLLLDLSNQIGKFISYLVVKRKDKQFLNK